MTDKKRKKTEKLSERFRYETMGCMLCNSRISIVKKRGNKVISKICGKCNEPFRSNLSVEEFMEFVHKWKPR